MRILLVEDDATLAAGIARALRAENFAVDVAGDGEDGQHLGETELYDAAILDIGLPKIDGISVLRAWRAADRDLPVLILTARDGWSEKVEGFKAGADDYLTKPFRTEEVDRAGGPVLDLPSWPDGYPGDAVTGQAAGP